MFYRKFLFIIVTLISLITHSDIFAKIVYPDFFTSMLRTYSVEEERLKRANAYESANKHFLQLFKSIYEKNSAEASLEQSSDYRIPRIVHQIWLGGPVPEKYTSWMQTWASMRGWEYKLWTDADIAEFSMYNRDIYDQSTNLGEKSDIARLEILNRFGGLYVDVDFECFKPEIFDELHQSFDFYMCFEPLEHGFINYFNMFKVCNALIASRANHPLMQDLVTNLRANYHAYDPHCGTIEKTGPSYLTRIICRHEQRKLSDYRNIYLPSTFFFLFSDPEIKFYACHPEHEARLLPESAAIHYWSGSWRIPRGCSESYISRKKY
jgi:mannosyltransferase OCH1-like enzyme